MPCAGATPVTEAPGAEQAPDISAHKAAKWRGVAEGRVLHGVHLLLKWTPSSNYCRNPGR